MSYLLFTTYSQKLGYRGVDCYVQNALKLSIFNSKFFSGGYTPDCRYRGRGGKGREKSSVMAVG